MERDEPRTGIRDFEDSNRDGDQSAASAFAPLAVFRALPFARSTAETAANACDGNDGAAVCSYRFSIYGLDGGAFTNPADNSV